MAKHKLLIITSLVFLYFSCGTNSEQKKSAFQIKIDQNKKEFKLEESINGNVEDKNESNIDSVTVYLNTESFTTTGPEWNFSIPLKDQKLGNQQLEAKIYHEGQIDTASIGIQIYNDVPPVTYTYKIINTYPHSPKAYTQGLEFFNDTLYESTGQYGKSQLRKVDYKTGKSYKEVNLPEAYFGEGLTIWKDKILQLTWRSKEGFIYDLHSFEKTGIFNYTNSEQGWGLCHDDTHIYKSDGTEKIWLLDTETFAEKDYIQVTTHKNIVSKMNELEWINGKIYANTYQKDGVAIINPKNGAIEGIIDFRGLREKLGNTDALDKANDVLNGIAYNPNTKQLFVTGKQWDTLFEVEIIKK
ncbi:glutaminyl-peptide cyclotransferase [Zunongwangia sp.]|uniref:glutaminyl-peptide cyclotransferase n=1 Tax=Zunongwangia sp. TaxID=1965325 RepID=UPI003AA958C8